VLLPVGWEMLLLCLNALRSAHLGCVAAAVRSLSRLLHNARCRGCLAYTVSLLFTCGGGHWPQLLLHRQGREAQVIAALHLITFDPTSKTYSATITPQT
jgi:hypothetical protein